VTHTIRPDTDSPAPLTCLALSHVTATSQGGQSQQRKIFAGCWDKSIYSWTLILDAVGQIKSVSKRSTFRGHTDFIKALQCSTIANSDILISASADATINVWNASTGAKLHTLKGHSRGVQALAIDPLRSNADIITIFSGDSNQEIRCWTITASEAKEVPTNQKDEATVTPGETISPLLVHETSIYALRFERSSDSDFDLWTASADKTAKCLSRHRNFTPDTVFRHPDFVRDVVIDEASGYVITACRDEEVRVWEKSDGKLYHTFSGHFEEVTGLSIVESQKKGRWLVSVSIDGTVRRWNLARAELAKAKEEAENGEEAKQITEEKPKTSLLTEEEERELAELMDDDD
jgi:WD40 repeat protein